MKPYQITIAMGNAHKIKMMEILDQDDDGAKFFGTVRQDTIAVADEMTLETYMHNILFFQGNVEPDAAFAFVVIKDGDDVLEWRKEGVKTLNDFENGDIDVDTIIAKVRAGEDLGVKGFNDV